MRGCWKVSLIALCRPNDMLKTEVLTCWRRFYFCCVCKVCQKLAWAFKDLAGFRTTCAVWNWVCFLVLSAEKLYLDILLKVRIVDVDDIKVGSRLKKDIFWRVSIRAFHLQQLHYCKNSLSVFLTKAKVV